jgi:hypothetical protein
VTQVTDPESSARHSSGMGSMVVPTAKGKLDMTQIDHAENSEIRDLSLEEMEQVCGGLRNFPTSLRGILGDVG